MSPSAARTHVLAAPDAAPLGRPFKVLHLVRHGEGTHNVTHKYHSEAEFDAQLTDRGHAQAKRAGQMLRDVPIELVVASPLSRALQTAMGATSEHPDAPKLVVHEACREVMSIGMEPCNRRRLVSELTTRYPIPAYHYPAQPADSDSGWRGDETDPVVLERGRAFLEFLLARPETHIAVFTHQVFLFVIMNQGVSANGVQATYFDNGEVRTVVLHRA